MPSSSEKQRRFMGAELARKRAGQKTQTGMDQNQLEDFARKPIRSTARTKRSTARGSRRK